MKFSRTYSAPGDPYAGVAFEPRTSRIANPDGKVVFEAKDIQIPTGWTQVATDIIAQKYFRKAGVPSATVRVPEDGVPEWLWRSEPAPDATFGSETDSRQVFHRLAGCWAYWAFKHGYFDDEFQARAYYDEMCAMLARQVGAPNSPQWFNTGLHWAYGIAGPAQGHSFVDPVTAELKTSTSAYEHPAPHACFIQSVNDDLVNEGGIMDLWVREARIFKFGSGTGSNFSAIRGEGEKLSGGGTSSGLMSFLKVGDRAAGAIKSGGTTRRAAKMVTLDLDHPDILTFIDWKVSEEQKVSDLVAGSIACEKHLNNVITAANSEAIPEGARLDPALNPQLKGAIRNALNAGIPGANVQYAIDFARQGYKEIYVETYDTNWDSKAYGTVSGQNSNNSVRIPNDFFARLDAKQSWDLIRRTDGRVHQSMPAEDMWEKIAIAAWQCADPGVQYDTTINEWHTCPNDGRINASNPCSEYMFLDDTACFAPETRVSTPNGLRTVEELFEAQQAGERVSVTTDIHSEYDHRRVTAHRPALVTKVGVRDVYRMTLKDGRQVRATADHRFLTADGEWKRLDQIEVGKDRISIRESGNPVNFASNEPDAKRWQMLGWLSGDGVFSKDTVALVFGPHERSTAIAMTEQFNELKAAAAGSTALRESTISTQSNGVMQLSSKQVSIVRYLEERYGFKQGLATTKNVPAAVHQVSDDLKVAYLQGLFSADGCIRPNFSGTEPEVMLASSSPEMLRSVQLMLSDLGIVSRIAWTHPTGRPNPQGQLHIYNQQARKYMALIGFPCSEAKQLLVDQILETPFAGALKNPRSPKVLSIEPAGTTTVYDISEAATHSLIVEGMIAHNCNLASLNLVTFLDEASHFDPRKFAEACRIWTFTLEISVLMAQFPSRTVAQKSYDFRTLGLGYANMGTMLMRIGLPYDSDEGYGWCAAISALMTGAAYKCSAEMARELGPFPRYDQNADAMGRVLRNHRHAAYAAPSTEYEELSVVPVTHQPTLFTQETWALARSTWDHALAIGEVAGYRNAQVTCIAPTGTIGLLMDCDTTGIEPDFALVKFKKLAGGGYFKIVNQSVEPALRRLGYNAEQIRAIESLRQGHEHARGHAARQPRGAAYQGLHRRRSSIRSRANCSARSKSASSSTSTSWAKSSAARRSA